MTSTADREFEARIRKCGITDAAISAQIPDLKRHFTAVKRKQLRSMAAANLCRMVEELQKCGATVKWKSQSKRRPGRPPSTLQKVTRTIRIPEEINTFLNKYGEEHGMLKGDIIAEAILHFRVKLAQSKMREPVGVKR
jgi:hypothetical protein